MRPSCFPIGALAILLTVAASAQESLCSPCVDVPVSIPRQDLQRIKSPVPVTGGELLGVGIPSAPEAIDPLRDVITSQVMQLRYGIPGPQAMPVSLGDPAAFPVPIAPVFSAAMDHLQSRDYDAGAFSARLIGCTERNCILDIFPTSLGNPTTQTMRACPAEYCATMSFSLQGSRVLEIREWRPEE